MIKVNKNKDVLLVVDYQNDFISGSMAVSGAEDLLPVINKCLDIFNTSIFSRDRHKADHPSFEDQGGPWPDHCVDSTYGMELHAGLVFPNSTSVALVDKGWDEEAYSAFNSSVRPSIPVMLGLMKAERLFICGLATDYCVKATVLDAVEKFNGEVFLLTDAIAAVNINPDDGDKAIKEMENAGVTLITSEDLHV